MRGRRMGRGFNQQQVDTEPRSTERDTERPRPKVIGGPTAPGNWRLTPVFCAGSVVVRTADSLKVGVHSLGRDGNIAAADPSMSRRHADVVYDGADVKGTDLSSCNGLFVNGERLSRTALSPGDVLRAGSSLWIVEGDSGPSHRDLGRSFARGILP